MTSILKDSLETTLKKKYEEYLLYHSQRTETNPDFPQESIVKLLKILKQSKDKSVPKLCFFDEDLPGGLSEVDFVKSIILNYDFDFKNISISIPNDFDIDKSQSNIHAGNTLQLRIIYNKIAKSLFREGISENVAAIGFQIVSRAKEKEFRIQDIQGELKAINEKDKQEQKYIRRIFGKLNTHFDKNWRVGIVENLKQYASNNNSPLNSQLLTHTAFYYTHYII